MADRVGLVEKLCGFMNEGEGGASNTSFGDDSREWMKDGSMTPVAVGWKENWSPGIILPPFGYPTGLRPRPEPAGSCEDKRRGTGYRRKRHRQKIQNTESVKELLLEGIVGGRGCR